MKAVIITGVAVAIVALYLQVPATTPAPVSTEPVCAPLVCL